MKEISAQMKEYRKEVKDLKAAMQQNQVQPIQQPNLFQTFQHSNQLPSFHHPIPMQTWPTPSEDQNQQSQNYHP